MDKEKQIEEMASTIWNYSSASEQETEEVAEVLYNKGYRKQSEGKWVDQYDGKYANPIYVCSICGKGTLLRPHINELDNMEMIQALSLFCPNCGAKMGGGAE